MKLDLQRVFIIFRKETRDNLRDRRSIFSSMLSSLIGPALLLLMIIIVGRTFNASVDEPVDLPVHGAELAPTLIQFLEQNGARIVPAPQDPQAAVLNGDVNIVLLIPPDYRDEFSQGYPASLRLIFDSTRQSALTDIRRVQQLLNGYNSQIGAMRLLARGINPAVITPLAIEEEDLATPQTQALIFLNMMPYFIVMVVFLGGMYVIIDTTAGERERGSLEPLLINPVQRSELVIGKMAASWPFATVTLLVTLLAFLIVFNAFPLEETIGFQLSIDPAALINIFFLSLPMILLASGLQMIIATFTRSFKEAQTYVAFLPLIPALPGIALAFLPIKTSLWAMFIPTFGQQLIINQWMRGESVDPLNVLVVSVFTIFISIFLIFFAVKLYQRERLLFSGR